MLYGWLEWTVFRWCVYVVRDQQSFLISADTFKAKAQENGKPCDDLRTEVFFPMKNDNATPTKKSTASAAAKLPPRLASDQMINIFFQEWAPLFPVVHRPTVLKTYTEYVASPHDVRDKHAITQMNLIFAIAALSNEVCR